VALLKTPPGTGSFLRSLRSKYVPVPVSEVGFSTEPDGVDGSRALVMKLVAAGVAESASLAPSTCAKPDIGSANERCILKAYPKSVGDCPNFAQSAEQNGTVPILFGTRFAPAGLFSSAQHLRPGG
jgi:hypothetical protein